MDQAGFVPGFSTEDHLFTVTLLQEKFQEWRHELWIATIDFKKAFDTISHASMWEALREQGVPAGYVHLLSKIYFEQTGTIKLDCASKHFRIERGVRQGDPLSPTLFNALLETVFRVLKRRWTSMGVGIRMGPRDEDVLSNLRFADDVLLTATSLQQLSAMLQDLRIEAGRHGLELHPGKTKIITNKLCRKGAEAAQYVDINGLRVDILASGASTKYLGRMLCSTRPHHVEVDNRIRQAWNKFFANKHVLCDRRVALRQRLQLFDAVITPTILYGAGSWVLTEELKSRIRKTQRRMLRSIFQRPRRRNPGENESRDGSTSGSSREQLLAPEVDDEDLEPWVDWIRRVTHEIEDSLSRYNIEPWEATARRRLYSWAGHVCRRADGRWSTKVLHWTPEQGARQGGKGPGRRQSRPCTRWTDAFDEFFARELQMQPGDWRLLAVNKVEWDQHMADFVANCSR